MKRLARWYLVRKRGAVYAYRPPIGWTPWDRPSLARKINYWLRWADWQIDCRLKEWAQPPCPSIFRKECDQCHDAT